MWDETTSTCIFLAVQGHSNRGGAMRNPSEAVQQHFKVLNTICVGILSGIVIFSAAVWYLGNGGGFTPPEGIPGFTATLANVAALLAIGKAALLPRLFPPS